MADETKVEAQAAAEAPAKVAEAPAKVAEAVADTVETIAKESAKVAKKTRAATARRVKREAVAQKKATRRTARKTHTPRKIVGARKTARVAQERIETVTNTNFFNGFDAVPAFAPFQSFFADANERSQDLVKKSQKVAEELADLARANVEAVVEAGRVAAEGARAIGQDVVASNRDNVEQAADAIRSLAEAKSPTEYLQLQGEFARSQFDRAVAETSKLTESLVKLAGEAFQPISNRATANAERFNTLVA
ncbi:MAG TPA: phasin family protein [Sphingomicrobium sp.]|nr:phasin family protein [Sphingomicrobium sp.]